MSGKKYINKEKKNLRQTILRAEANLIRLPLFALNKEKFDGQRIDLPNGGSIRIVKMPSYRAKKLMYHVIMRMVESKKAFGKVVVPVEFNSEREVRRLLGANAVQVRDILTELADARYTAHFAVKIKSDDGELRDLDGKMVSDYREYSDAWIPFNLVDFIIYRGQEYKYKGKKYVSNNLKIIPSKWIINNIENNYYRPIAYDVWESLPPLAQRLYEVMTTNFYASGGNTITILYSTLCSLLPVKRQRYLSRILQILGPNFDTLIKVGILNDWSYEKRKELGELDVLFTFIPGPVILNTPVSLEPIVDSIKSLYSTPEVNHVEPIEREEKGEPQREKDDDTTRSKPVRTIADIRGNIQTLFDTAKKVSRTDGPSDEDLNVRKNVNLLRLYIPQPLYNGEEAEHTFQLIKSYLHDRHSYAFYRLVSERLPYDVVHEMLSVIKNDTGLNVKSPSAYFTKMVMEYAEKYAKNRRG